MGRKVTIKVDWQAVTLEEEECGIDSDTEVPEITVVAYKKSGKYYSEETRKLELGHYGTYHESAELWKNIHSNSISVRSYSPISGGFVEGYTYTVTVKYPDDMEGFCTFLWDNTRER